jgi:single-strand DNA-binding protein
MVNESFFSVRGYVATQPRSGYLKDGTTRTFSARVGWTPRLLNRSTGEWTDQPTSFVSLQCYGKIAEHAALCVHRGDPVVLTGRLRVREYTDQAGAKRNSVEVTADSFGHDMSRGISIHTKAPQHQDQTAAEVEQAMAAGRSPLPGDLAAQQGADDESARDVDELGPGYQPDVHLDGAADFDEESSAEMAGHEDLPEPVRATA